MRVVELVAGEELRVVQHSVLPGTGLPPALARGVRTAALVLSASRSGDPAVCCSATLLRGGDPLAVRSEHPKAPGLKLCGLLPVLRGAIGDTRFIAVVRKPGTLHP